MKYGIDFQDDDLIISLSSLQQFYKEKQTFDSGEAFMEFYLGLLECIKAYAQQKPSPYFTEKLAELPSISANEIESFINEREDKNYRSTRGSGNSIFFLVLEFFNLSNRSFGANHTKNKLLVINDIAQNLVYVLRHPGFEELLYKNK